VNRALGGLTRSTSGDGFRWDVGIYYPSGVAPSAARQQSNTRIDAENAVINGLLSEISHKEIFNDIHVLLAEMPGLIPAL
jgi:hypothetical protein